MMCHNKKYFADVDTAASAFSEYYQPMQQQQQQVVEIPNLKKMQTR